MASAAGKTCNKCGKSYKGFGVSCSSCRKLPNHKGTAHDCEKCGNFFVGFGEICADCQSGSGPGRTGVPLPTPEEVDTCLGKILTCLNKVDVSQDSMVRLRKAEIDLLVNYEFCRDLMQRILKSGDRLLLKRTFVDCGRVAKLRAFLDMTVLSENNAKDQRFRSCESVCTSIEEMVGSDLGLSVQLQEATTGESSKLLMSRLSVVMDPSRFEEFRVEVEPHDIRKYGDSSVTWADEESDEYESDWEEEEDWSEERQFQIFRDNVQRLFDELDADKNGKLTKDEVKNAGAGLSNVLKACKIYKRKHVIKLFREGDLDGDGTLDFEEFLTYIIGAQERAYYAQMPKLSPETVEMVFKTMDKDGDGTITCEELKFAYAGILLRSGEKVDAKRVGKWAKRNFKKYDTDGSQALDIHEFRNLLENCGGLQPMVECMQRYHY